MWDDQIDEAARSLTTAPGCVDLRTRVMARIGERTAFKRIREGRGPHAAWRTRVAWAALPAALVLGLLFVGSRQKDPARPVTPGVPHADAARVERQVLPPATSQSAPGTAPVLPMVRVANVAGADSRPQEAPALAPAVTIEAIAPAALTVPFIEMKGLPEPDPLAFEVLVVHATDLRPLDTAFTGDAP